MKIYLFLLPAALLFSCQQNKPAQVPETVKEEAGPADLPETRKGMIKVTILYPNGEGMHFDMDYYKTKHMPMLQRLMGDSLKAVKIDKGLGGRPGEPIPYLAIGYLYFERLSAYESTFGPNAKEILADIPKYTNIKPVVQVSEVLQ
ncbi:EthD family reductase [Chitinophaga caseinilytica]|uniref:EthD family reductase n=1 Tax=Chitinophaga caseinilytica TaxID=2267521 RepID=UPI003C2DC4E1